jgi:hypothetical protein
MFDSLFSRRRRKFLTIKDEVSRQCPWVEVAHSIGGHRVVEILRRLKASTGLPRSRRGEDRK